MSTTLTDLGTDHWVCLPATWELYAGLLEARGERGRPRYIFCDGRLTVVSPGTPHEIIKSRLGGLIEDMLVGLRIDFLPTGEVTLLKRRRSRAGAEADESYYLRNIEHVRGTRKLVMGEDPAPDLVLEVVVSHPEDDALKVYELFGVREVWVCKETGLEFLVLGDEGYAPSPTSSLLPFLAADELAPWVFRQDFASEAPIRRLFRAWVEETLAPRHRPEPEG